MSLSQSCVTGAIGALNTFGRAGRGIGIDPPSLDVRLGGKLVTGLPKQAGNVLLTRTGLKPA